MIRTYHDAKLTKGEEANLTDAEIDLLSRHLGFYVDLSIGSRIPRTDAQRHFVKVFNGRETAFTPHEEAFRKFRAILSKRSMTSPEKSKATKAGIPEYEEGSPRPGWTPLGRFQ
jgi:uncharacterized protein YifE (UPF0438 family)